MHVMMSYRTSLLHVITASTWLLCFDVGTRNISSREYDGSLLRHESYVFLDAQRLANMLKPVVLHNDRHTRDGNISLGKMGEREVVLSTPQHKASWKRLKSDGILEPELARKLWTNDLSAYVLSTLKSIGLTFPLPDDDRDGLVVPLRLPMNRPKDVGDIIERFSREYPAAFRLSWTFPLDVPPGMIERVLTRCCSLGATRVFWRFGGLVKGNPRLEGIDGTFALLLEYLRDNKKLSMDVYGYKMSVVPWAALSFFASAVLHVVQDFPGLKWEGSLVCPEHNQQVLQVSHTVSYVSFVWTGRKIIK